MHKLLIGMTFESPKIPILGDVAEIIKTISQNMPVRAIRSVTHKIIERQQNISLQKMFEYKLDVELDSEQVSLKELDSTVFHLQDVITVPKKAWDDVRVSMERA